MQNDKINTHTHIVFALILIKNLSEKQILRDDHN